MYAHYLHSVLHLVVKERVLGDTVECTNQHFPVGRCMSLREHVRRAGRGKGPGGSQDKVILVRTRTLSPRPGRSLAPISASAYLLTSEGREGSVSRSLSRDARPRTYHFMGRSKSSSNMFFFRVTPIPSLVRPLQMQFLRKIEVFPRTPLRNIRVIVLSNSVAQLTHG